MDQIWALLDEHEGSINGGKRKMESDIVVDGWLAPELEADNWREVFSFFFKSITNINK